MIVDIDRFKRVNDTHGHLAGDMVIRSVGQMMSAELGAFGSVARVGGEEFALLSSGVPAHELAEGLITFRERVEATSILVNGSAVKVTISAGVAVRSDGDTFDQLFSHADRALYAAKTSGRNRVRFGPMLENFDRLDGDGRETSKTRPVRRSA